MSDQKTRVMIRDHVMAMLGAPVIANVNKLVTKDRVNYCIDQAVRVYVENNPDSVHTFLFMEEDGWQEADDMALHVMNYEAKLKYNKITNSHPMGTAVMPVWKYVCVYFSSQNKEIDDIVKDIQNGVCHRMIWVLSKNESEKTRNNLKLWDQDKAKSQWEAWERSIQQKFS